MRTIVVALAIVVSATAVGWWLASRGGEASAVPPGFVLDHGYLRQAGCPSLGDEEPWRGAPTDGALREATWGLPSTMIAVAGRRYGGAWFETIDGSHALVIAAVRPREAERVAIATWIEEHATAAGRIRLRPVAFGQDHLMGLAVRLLRTLGDDAPSDLREGAIAWHPPWNVVRARLPASVSGRADELFELVPRCALVVRFAS